MDSLFQSEPIVLHLQDAEIIYFAHFFDKKEADAIFRQLAKEIPWQQDDIQVFGKIHPQPRLTALFGNEGKPYSYSNIKMQPYPWTLLLQKIKSYVESVSDTNFTTVLLNQYRDGKDSNGWHADNEKELGENPIIASLSFGTSRRFDLKHISKAEKLSVELKSGSLLVMSGETQHYWKHQIAKSKKITTGRINLTFRTIRLKI